MSADELLDQDHWTPDLAHLLVEHGAAIHELRAHRLTADQQVRTAALHAAVHRHADVPSWERDGTTTVLTTATRLAHWINTGEDPTP